MKPTLLALDFKARRVRRYFPKPTGSFLVQEAILTKPDDDKWQSGSEAGLAILEAFRTGRLPVEDLPDVPEVA